ncbi:glycosyltransferase [uncultured Roseibium sp.]|uniref:glycosyltransferase n=1 Tax=uncultured Roseibium sp. TaxID=1936171 RepID=UPI00261BF137|nr:glycosyltransferase [uncultured Roseibium sp.]
MARSSAIRLDICVLADIRKGDVASPSHAASLEAFVAEAYSVGVLPVASPAIASDPYTLDPCYRRLFEDARITRLAPGAAVECSLALGLDARLFAAPMNAACNIKAEHRVVTLERPASFTSLTPRQRELMRSYAEEVLGGSIVWAPNTRISRDALFFAAPHWPTTEKDWVPVVPTHTPRLREATEGARPSVGMARVARARPVLPADWGENEDYDFSSANVMWRLRLAPDAHRPSWPQAAPMQVWPDTEISLADFFAKIDILANADTAAEEPCPIEVLYSLRSGVVPFLEPEYRTVFSGTAIYGRCSELTQRALEFYDNPDLASDLRDGAEDLIATTFSANAAVKWLRLVIGKPRVNSFAPAVHATPNSTALFFSTNGVGLGHLTRQLAIARRLPSRITPVFLSHSKAIDIIGAHGFVAEHLPYHAAYGERKEHWNAALADALETAIAFYRPRAVVFDGNVPFVGLMKAMEASPDAGRVWIRRAFWGSNRDLDALERGEAFDLIVEPGELAWARDDGPTVALRPHTREVPPVTLLDGHELLERSDACERIGLDPDQTNILIALGAGNNIDTSNMIARALAHLHGRSRVGVAVAQWRIAEEALELPPGVARLTEYPFSKFLRAFDFAVAAAGYNTFAEHVKAALPTIWVPNEHAEQDQQILRARFAVAQNLGLLVRHAAPFDLTGSLDRMLQSDAGDEMRAAHEPLRQEYSTNGAVATAQAIASLCETVIVREGQKNETFQVLP